MGRDLKRVRIAVVGTGWWSTRVHLPALLENRSCQVVAVVDADPARASRTAAHFGVERWYADHRALLAEVAPEGVVVATPPGTHEAIALDCVRAGADVLVEKPMAVTSRSAGALVRASRRWGRRLHVGYPYPYSRLSQTLRTLVRTEALGELRLLHATLATAVRPLYLGVPHTAAEDALFPPDPGTYDDTRRGGGQLHSQVTHIASLLWFLTGLRIERVQAFTSGDTPRADGWDALCFRTDRSAVGTLASAGTVAAGSATVERVELFGDRGHAVYDLGHGTLIVCGYDGRRVDDRVNSEAERYPCAAPSERLVAALRGEADVLVGAEAGFFATALIEAAHRSAATGRPARPALLPGIPRLPRAPGVRIDGPR